MERPNSPRGRIRHRLIVVLVLLFASGSAWAQDEPAGEDEGTGEGAADSADDTQGDVENDEPSGRSPGVIRLPGRDTPSEEDGGTETEVEDPDSQAPATDEDAPTDRDDDSVFTPGGREESLGGAPIIRPQRLVGDPEEEYPGFFEDDFDPFNPPSSLRVRLDFPDAELTDIVLWFSQLMGQNFIIADNVHAGKRITIIGPEPVTIREAYSAFLAALHMNGLTVVPYGSYMRIVPEDSIARQSLPFTPAGRAPRDDRMVTQVLPLDFVDASSITDLLESMKTEAAIIQVYQPTNTLIITETGTNLNRLLELIDIIDQPGGDTRFIYQVRYAEAEELRNVLIDIFGEPDESSSGRREETARERAAARRRRAREGDDAESTSAEGGTVRVSQIIADSRTNQLIVVSSPRSYEAIREMAEALDIPIAGEGQIHVLFLENANATELAGTLQGLTQSVEEQREEAGARRGRGDDDDGDGGGGQIGAISATFTGNVSITADEPTNSLVVVASLRDFLNLQRVVEQLDRRREQVYVEAVIMEVTVSTDSTFGMALNAGALPNIGGEDVPVFAASTLGSLSSIVLDPTALQGLAVGVRGPEVEGTEGLLAPGIGLPSFGAILQAIQTDSNVNVISTPHILTTDNEEAEIVVGENIPFISGGSGGVGSLLGGAGGLDLGNIDSGDLSSLAFGSGLGFPTFNVQRESVSLTLRIRPQINESNFVRLEIEETIEDVISFDELRGPTTSNREARTVVVVEDQQTVVIGGLLEDDVTETVDKVPVLGDIPVIGYLFRRTTNRVVKRNLLLLLTPYIIRDPSDFHAIFRRKMREREEFLEFFGREDLGYVADIDYSRKNGPLESMVQTLRAAVETEEARRRAQGLHDRPQLRDSLEASPIGDGDGGEE